MFKRNNLNLLLSLHKGQNVFEVYILVHRANLREVQSHCLKVIKVQKISTSFTDVSIERHNSRSKMV